MMDLRKNNGFRKMVKHTQTIRREKVLSSSLN